MVLSFIIFSMIQWNDFLSSVDVDMVDQTTLKSHISLNELFYLYVIELILLGLKLPLAQQIGIKAQVEDLWQGQREQNTEEDDKRNFS